MARYRKKLRRYSKPPKYNLGGSIGTVIGGVGGALIGQPALGATVGGALGSGAEKLLTPEEEEIERITRSAGYLGYKYGGKYTSPSKQRYGGVTPMGRDAVKYNGPKHEQGGIPIDGRGNPTNTNRASAEVEGGETRDGDYIFSDTLTVPGTEMTFAQAHEQLIQNDAPEKQINRLKQLQERAQEEAGVQGGDEQGTKPMPENGANKAGAMTQRAKKVANEGATGKGAGNPVGYGRDMKGGGKLKRYQYGGPNDPPYGSGTGLTGAFNTQSMFRDMEEDFSPPQYSTGIGTAGVGNTPVTSPQAQGSRMNIESATVNNPKVDPSNETYEALGVTDPTQASPSGGTDWGGIADAAGYAIPSIMRAGMALTDKGVESTPKMRAETVPVQSKAFRGAERDIESSYRSILADPNASTTEKLAAQSQLIQARSDLAGQEADYRSRQQRFNVGQRSQAQAQNIRSFQQDRDVRAREEGARKQMLMQAVDMPVTQFRADKAGKRNQIANVITSANRIQDPTDRRRTVERNLRALGLSDSEIQNIIRRYES